MRNGSSWTPRSQSPLTRALWYVFGTCQIFAVKPKMGKSRYSTVFGAHQAQLAMSSLLIFQVAWLGNYEFWSANLAIPFITQGIRDPHCSISSGYSWFNDLESILVHHLTTVIGLACLGWAGHLIHVAYPIEILLSTGLDPQHLPSPRDLLTPTWTDYFYSSLIPRVGELDWHTTRLPPCITWLGSMNPATACLYLSDIFHSRVYDRLSIAATRSALPTRYVPLHVNIRGLLWTGNNIPIFHD